MPDEKIDQQRRPHAESESKPIQQRHVDDAGDDSFPASDPPAWTTSASKSVAAECRPEALNAVPVPPGEGSLAATMPNRRPPKPPVSLVNIYRRGQTSMGQGRRYVPEAERFYPRVHSGHQPICARASAYSSGCHRWSRLRVGLDAGSSGIDLCRDAAMASRVQPASERAAPLASVPPSRAPCKTFSCHQRGRGCKPQKQSFRSCQRD